MSDEFDWEDGILYCPHCGAMNAKIRVKKLEWCENCREDWPEEEIPDESLETLREKFA